MCNEKRAASTSRKEAFSMKEVCDSTNVHPSRDQVALVKDEAEPFSLVPPPRAASTAAGTAAASLSLVDALDITPFPTTTGTCSSSSCSSPAVPGQDRRPGAYLNGNLRRTSVPKDIIRDRHHEESERTAADSVISTHELVGVREEESPRAPSAPNGLPTTVHPSGFQEENEEILVEASPVDLQEEPDLPEAIEYHNEDQPHHDHEDEKTIISRKKGDKTRRVFILCNASIAILVVVLLCFFIDINNKNSNNESTAVGGPQQAVMSIDDTTTTTTTTTTATTTTAAFPSSPAPSPDLSFNLELPDTTWNVIRSINSSSSEEVERSPQTRAYRWLTSDPSFGTYSMTRKQQRFALATLYYATSGPTAWNQNEGWLSYDSHECDWFAKGGFGYESFSNSQQIVLRLEEFFETSLNCSSCAVKNWVTNVYQMNAIDDSNSNYSNTACNDNDEYTRLLLYNNQLQGTIPPEVFLLLPSLQSWDVSVNSGLQGTIPTEIGMATALKYFWHPFTNHNGHLPTELGLLSNLEILRISESAISGSLPSELAQLSNILYLFIQDSYHTGTIPQGLFSNLDQLAFLSLRSNALTGNLSELEYLQNTLHRLELFNNQFTGTLPLQEMTHLSKLRYLFVEENNLSGSVPTEIGLFTNLLSLQLSNNPTLQGQLPTELDRLSNLRFLNLTNTNVTGSMPSLLCNLPTLTLDELALSCSSTFCGCNCSDCSK